MLQGKEQADAIQVIIDELKARNADPVYQANQKKLADFRRKRAARNYQIEREMAVINAAAHRANVLE